MSWGLAVWRADGFQVINLNSVSYSVIASGALVFNNSSTVHTVSVPRIAEHGSRLQLIANPGSGSWEYPPWPTLERVTGGFTVRITADGSTTFPVSIAYQAILR